MTVAPRPDQRAPQRHKVYNSTNAFDLDLSKKPPEMAYRWVRKQLAGQDDPENMINADLNDWTPVPGNRHPEVAGRAATSQSEIIRKGLVLMEQPQVYQKESEDLDKFEARNALESQIARLGLQARRNGAKGISRAQDTVDVELVE